MHCPKCMAEFDHPIYQRTGKHEDHECSCGQLLQWDQTMERGRSGQWTMGAPQTCNHPDKRKSGALIPLSDNRLIG